jgi:hypothetical protein
MKRVQPLGLLCCACVIVFMAASPRAHPHGDEPDHFDLKGVLTKIDVVNRTIELDTIDPSTKAPRNMLLFVDKKVKLRQGRARVELGALAPGQRVTCTVERVHNEGGRDRLTAFEIRLDALS